jgi:hypothetical protein
MFYSCFHREGYDLDYIAIRERLDNLCDKITGRKLTCEEAFRQYENISTEFKLLDDSRVELFEMIYKSRIIRLCKQYALGGV